MGVSHQLNRCYISEFGKELENKLIQNIGQLNNSKQSHTLVITPTNNLKERIINQFFTYTKKRTLQRCELVTINALINELANHINAPFTFNEQKHTFTLLLKQVAQKKESIYKSYRNCASLYETIKDLQEANVNPEDFLDLTTHTAKIKENRLISEIYNLYTKLIKHAPSDNDMITKMLIISNLRDNKWLQKFTCIYLYGFYDLNQLQADLFKEIVNLDKIFHIYTPVPLDESLNITKIQYEYSKSFVESTFLNNIISRKDFSISMLKHKQTDIEKTIDRILNHKNCPVNNKIKIISAPGTYEQCLQVLTTIQSLLEKGIPYEDICITARNTAKYIPYLIPLSHDMGIPVSHKLTLSCSPTALKKINNALSLKLHGMNIRRFLDLDITQLDSEERAIVQKLIESGDEQILNNNRILNNQFLHDIFSIRENETQKLSKLAKDYQALNKQLSKFQERDSYRNYLKQLEDLYSFLAIDHDELKGLTDYLYAIHSERANVTLEDFADIIGSFQNSSYKQSGQGVKITDCMNIKGLQYKYVFIMGLNQDEFPAQIYEDPLLPDKTRLAIRNTLGYHITVKQERFNEEKLLFYLSCKAATRQLYFSFNTSDNESDELAPSVFIEQLILTNSVRETHSMPKAESGAEIRYVGVRKRILERYAKIYYSEGTSEFEGKTRINLTGILNNKTTPSKLQEHKTCSYKFLARQILRIPDIIYRHKTAPPQLTNRVLGNLIDKIYKIHLAGTKELKKELRKNKQLLKSIFGCEVISKISNSILPLTNLLQILTSNNNYYVTAPDNKTSARAYGWTFEGIPDLVLKSNNETHVADIKYNKMLKNYTSSRDLASKLISNSYLQFLIYPLMYENVRSFCYVNADTLMEYPDINNILNQFNLSKRDQTDWRLASYLVNPNLGDIKEKLEQLMDNFIQPVFAIKPAPNLETPPCSYCGYMTVCHRNIIHTRQKASGITVRRPDNRKATTKVLEKKVK